MAFSYKNTLESALNKLPSKYSDQLFADTSDQIGKRIEVSNSLFSFSIKPELAELLASAGIEVAPVAFKNHTHPACKMIENYLLYIISPSFLSTYGRVAFFSLRKKKQEKFLEMFQVFSYGKIKSMGMYNAIIDAKDRSRYGPSPFTCLRDRINGLRSEALLCKQFPKVLFCHDEIHHWTLSDLCSVFELIPELSQVVGTLVFPSEILLGETSSKEPRIYDFELDERNDLLHFFPDGIRSEGYTQSISKGAAFFKHTGVTLSDGRFVRFRRINSVFAHHLFSFDISSPVESGRLFFNKPSCLLRSELEIIGENFLDACFERSTFLSICLYLSCLKSPNAASAVAKLRQLEKRSLFPDELSFLFSISSEISKYGLGNDISKGLLDRFKDSVLLNLPNWLLGDFWGREVFHAKIRKLLKLIPSKGFSIKQTMYTKPLLPPVSEVLSSAHAGVKVFVKDKLEAFLRPEPIVINRADSVILRSFGGVKETINTQSLPLGVCFSLAHLVNSDFHQGVDRVEVNMPFFSRGLVSMSLNEVILCLRRGRFVSPNVFGRICWSSGKLLTFPQGDNEVKPGASSPVPEPLSSSSPGDMLFEGASTPVQPGMVDDQRDFGGLPGVLPQDIAQASMSDISLDPKRKRKNDCVFKAVGMFVGEGALDLMNRAVNSDISDELFESIMNDQGLSRGSIDEFLALLDLHAVCTSDFTSFYHLNLGGSKTLGLIIRGNHCTLGDLKTFGKDCLDALRVSKDKFASSRASSSCCQGLDSTSFKVEMSSVLSLAKSMNRGTTGTISTFAKELIGELLEICESIGDCSFDVKTSLSLGFAGSGKSRSVLMAIKQNPTVKRLYISPRSNLAAEISNEVSGTACVVKTFETALKVIGPQFSEVILDEITLYPPGFIGLLLISRLRNSILKAASAKKKREVLLESVMKNFSLVCLGDPLQIRYYSGLDNILLKGSPDIDLICNSGGPFRYLWQSYRMGSWFQAFVDIPTKVDSSTLKPLFFSDLSSCHLDDYETVLCASQDQKSSFSSRIGVSTYGESQGRNFKKKSLIVVSHETFKSSPNALIVALTRSHVGFDFLLSGISVKELNVLSRKTILSFVFEGKRIPNDRFKNLLPNMVFTSTELVGSLEEKASSDLFILPFINLAPEVEVVEDSCEELTEPPEWFKTHLPVFDCNPLIAEIFDKMAEKEKREFRSILDQSNQFMDLEKGLEVGSVYPSQFQSIFPRHTSDDDETFWAGVKKRLSFSTATKERKKFDLVSSKGPELLKVFLENLPFEFRVTTDDILNGSRSFDDKRAEKTAALWEAHSGRSDIDWNLDRVFLFMKSQLCTKEGKMFTTAKAGQTLACFQHIVLFKFGPMLRAIESAFLRSIGESFYIHSGKNFFCLDAFVKRNQDLFDGRSIESDYEAFDSCQDHTVLAFEICLLEHLGINSQWISDYKTMKMNLGCGLGSLAIMRFTGEFCTFLFNTFTNMLFTFLKYDVNCRRDRILFAGDDMASIGHLKKRSCHSDHGRLLGLFSLKAVEEEREFPMFCGWYLTPYGILKSPRLLYARIMVMKEKKALMSCVDNYLFEAIFAYRLSERLFSILKEEDLEYHHLVTRFFIKNSNLLKGSSVQLLHEIGEGIGCRWSKSMSSSTQLSPRTSKLRPFPQRMSTRMHHFYGPRYCSQLRGLSPTSKSLLLGQTASSCLISSSLTTKRCHRSRATLASTITCILELFSEPSHRCSRTTRSLEEGSSFMMATALSLHMPTSLHSISTSKMGQPISFLGQDMLLLLRIQISLGDVKSRLSSTVPSMTATQSYLPSTWESCTEWQIHPVFCRMHMAQADGQLKPFKAVNSLNSMRRLSGSLRHPQRTNSSRMPGLTLGKAEEVSYFHRGLQGEEGTALKNCRRSSLSQLQVDLIERLFQTMSLQGEVLRIRRKWTSMFLWKELIDKESKILKAHRLRVPEGADFPRLEQDEETIMNHVLYLYCKYFFGNLAILGSSPSTVFMDVSFWTPNVDVEIPSAVELLGSKEKTTTTPASRVERINWLINLASDVPQTITYLHSLKYNAVKNITLRQFCEPFAKEAYDFLKENYHRGVVSNIYRKWPRAFKKAPWVAFDFAHTLNISLLSDDEKGVIDNMTRRLFKTEGAKTVFDAQSESTIELEG